MEDAVIEFWRRYMASDELERHRMAEQLAEIIDGCTAIKEKELRVHCIANYLRSYIDDVIEVCAQTKENEAS